MVKLEKKEVPVILVDGECAICNRSVQFIRKHSAPRTFMYRSLQSGESKRYLKKAGLPDDYLESVVLVEHDKAYTKSDAALRIAGKMKGLYPVFYIFLIVPRPIRDFFYNLVARHRHRLVKL